MALTDDDLLDIDPKGLGGFERAPRTLLNEHGDVYRVQLVAARWIDGWRERVLTDSITQTAEDYRSGFDDALREAVAHPRQGDFLPGGVLYEDEQNRR